MFHKDHASEGDTVHFGPDKMLQNGLKKDDSIAAYEIACYVHAYCLKYLIKIALDFGSIVFKYTFLLNFFVISVIIASIKLILIIFRLKIIVILINFANFYLIFIRKFPFSNNRSSYFAILNYIFF